MGIRREANALCVFLCNVSPILNFLHSHDDRFAAQIDFLLRAMRYGGQGGGSLPAYVPVSDLFPFLSFPVSRFEIPLRGIVKVVRQRRTFRQF